MLSTLLMILALGSQSAPNGMATNGVPNRLVIGQTLCLVQIGPGQFRPCNPREEVQMRRDLAEDAREAARDAEEARREADRTDQNMDRWERRFDRRMRRFEQQMDRMVDETTDDDPLPRRSYHRHTRYRRHCR